MSATKTFWTFLWLATAGAFIGAWRTLADYFSWELVHVLAAVVALRESKQLLLGRSNGPVWPTEEK